MITTTYTADTVKSMTVADAKKIGVQQYRNGKTFAAGNVRPDGFFTACVKANRLELVEALDHGWHVANLAEPVTFDDGTVMGYGPASTELEAICEA